MMKNRPYRDPLFQQWGEAKAHYPTAVERFAAESGYSLNVFLFSLSFELLIIIISISYINLSTHFARLAQASVCSLL